MDFKKGCNMIKAMFWGYSPAHIRVLRNMMRLWRRYKRPAVDTRI